MFDSMCLHRMTQPTLLTQFPTYSSLLFSLPSPKYYSHLCLVSFAMYFSLYPGCPSSSSSGTLVILQNHIKYLLLHTKLTRPSLSSLNILQHYLCTTLVSEEILLRESILGKVTGLMNQLSFILPTIDKVDHSVLQATSSIQTEGICASVHSTITDCHSWGVSHVLPQLQVLGLWQ